MRSQLVSPLEAEAGAARALEIRRAASHAGEIPGAWMLDSPGLSDVVNTARRLATVPGLPMLIEGERGTGVPELARMVHDEDPVARLRHFWMVPSCQVGQPELRRESLVDGTLFIEDIESLRPAAQEWVAELLAARMQSKGQSLRIIGGSRLSVGELLGHGGLSQELVHAMDVGRVVVPPLRMRIGDILPLAKKFLGHYAEWQGRPGLRFSEAAERKLMSHTYPANVRELRNIVERAAALAVSAEIDEGAIVLFDEAGTTTTLRAGLFRLKASGDSLGIAHFPSLAEVERDYLAMLIRECRGQRTMIARTMGVSYSTVLKKIAHYGFDVRAIVSETATSGRAAG